MDQLLAKMTNITYEILGIFVPGLVLILFLLFGWWCLGPLAATWSFGFLPQARIKEFSGLLALLNEDIRIGLLVGLLTAAYFLGHLLHWIARSPKAKVGKRTAIRRVMHCLLLRVPKSEHSFEPKLEPLFQECKSFFSLDVGADWRQYYPLAKCYLAANLQSSLVATYQNKYTLHRSLTAAAVVWFWLSLIGTIVALVELYFGGPEPIWVPLIGSLPLSLLLIWGFSDSYQYSWRLFGDALITEIYVLKKTKK